MVIHMNRRQLPFRIALLLIAVLAATAPYSVIAQSERIGAGSVQDRIAQAFDDEDYMLAAELLTTHLERFPHDMIALYNAACAFSQLGELDRAADHLSRSVRAGFVEFDYMAADPDLDNIRSHTVYARIMELRDEAYAKLGARLMETAREEFTGEEYRYETDDLRHINYVTALDDVSHQEMRRMLEAQADHLADVLFEDAPSYFTVIVVPTPEDAQHVIRDWSVGGIYEHPRRRLVARDIGLMLRHEFTHLMHYGHMERIGQQHSLWVQEGIAALYESYVLQPGGAIRFLPNQRHNLVRLLREQGKLASWRDLFSSDAEEFMRGAAENYPQVRSVFHFLDDHGKLVEWYRTYVETFEEDSSGIQAFETVFGTELEEVEKRWRTWLRVQPPVDDFVGRGDASLGVQFVEDGVNDGVLIDMVLRGSAAADAGLQSGDVIVSFDGQPVRSHFELLVAVGGKNVGDEVPVRVRRDGEYLVFQVVLRPLR